MQKAMRTLEDIKVHAVRDSKMPPVEVLDLPQGLPLYVTRGGSEPVLHLELVFRAGRAHASTPSVANATAAIMKEGTTNLTGGELAEELEYLGSTVKCRAGMDYLSVHLYCLSRHFRQSLGLVIDMLHNAIFPEAEISSYRQRKLQDLKISLKQNEYLANVELYRMLFGRHPYGHATTAEDLRGIDREHLLRHWKLLGKKNLTLFLSGKVTDKHVRIIEEALSGVSAGEPAPEYDRPGPLTRSVKELDGPQKLQCAIRMGNTTIARSHPDYPGLFFLNTIFGGYFGSRLMKNIRETKGLTYHINSSLETFAKATYFTIGTESNPDNKTVILSEIESEMQLLKQQPPSPQEVEMVRNYIMGNFMMQLDGPFHAMDVIKLLVIQNMSMEYFDDFTAAIRRLTPEDVQNLAVTYLNFEDMHRVVVS